MKDKLTIRQSIDWMFRYLSKGKKEVQPSKFWVDLGKRNRNQLIRYGYENFKKTVVRSYFANTPLYLINRQVLFLLLNLNPLVTIECLLKSLFLARHNLFTRIDSISFNFLTLLLRKYTEKTVNKENLNKLEEPLIGNPPRIILNNKLISQDLCNSLLEYESIFKSISSKYVKIIGELGAGSGRNAYVSISLMKNLQKYIIIDIPPALYVAQRYLSEIFPHKKIFRCQAFNSFSEIKDKFDKSDILFFLPNQIELLPDHFIDLFINISSLHEMRVDQIQYYFKQIERINKKNKYFYFKQYNNSWLPHEKIYIRLKDYPISPKWKIIFLRTPKVQVNFFEALLQLSN